MWSSTNKFEHHLHNRNNIYGSIYTCAPLSSLYTHKSINCRDWRYFFLFWFFYLSFILNKHLWRVAPRMISMTCYFFKQIQRIMRRFDIQKWSLYQSRYGSFQIQIKRHNTLDFLFGTGEKLTVETRIRWAGRNRLTEYHNNNMLKIIFNLNWLQVYFS